MNAPGEAAARRRTHQMLDVAVIGGGPGGLHAATLLARAGFAVTLFEEHDEIGRPVHCTGVLADDAFGEFDLPRTSILNTLTTAKFISPAGFQISYTTPSIEAHVVDRRRLDQSIAAQAAEILGDDQPGAARHDGLRDLRARSGKLHSRRRRPVGGL